MNRLMMATLALTGAALANLAGCTNMGPVSGGQAGSGTARPVAGSSTTGYVGVDPSTCWQTPLNSAPGSVTQQQRVAGIHLDMGVGYMQEGAFQIAAEELKISQSMEPDSAKLHNAKALLHSRLGDQELAKDSFHTALRLDPADPEVHNNYGIFLCGKGQLQLAQAHFQCAIANPLYSTPFLAYTNAGVCALKEPDTTTAKQHFRTSLQLYRRQPIAHLQLAKIYFDEGNVDLAESHYRSYKKIAKHTLESLRIGMRIAKARGDNNAYASLELLRRSMLSERLEIIQ